MYISVVDVIDYNMSESSYFWKTRYCLSFKMIWQQVGTNLSIPSDTYPMLKENFSYFFLRQLNGNYSQLMCVHSEHCKVRPCLVNNISSMKNPKAELFDFICIFHLKMVRRCSSHQRLNNEFFIREKAACLPHVEHVTP